MRASVEYTRTMPVAAVESHDRHAARSTRVHEGVVLIAVAAGISASVFSLGTWPSVIALAVASGATTLAFVLPWCRRHTMHAVRSATWIAERERGVAVTAAARDAARLQAIVDTATEVIITIDERGTIEHVNGAAERAFGYAADELIGRNVSMLMPQPYQHEHDGYLRRYLETGVARIIGIGREVTAKRKDGGVFPIDLSVGEGQVDGARFFTAIIRDISERKEMQFKLAQTERLVAVGELAAGVAHEVNNPINTIINCAQLIQDGDDADTNGKIIVEEGHRIADIVRDLLQFARDDRDKPQPTFLTEVVERTLRLLSENWKRHGISLRVDIPADLPPVHARPQQIQQVLLNLLINAKDALVHSGVSDRRVELSAKATENGVEFCVRDNGPGIPPALGDRIFEPFVTTKRARGGTGLGLSISRTIVTGYGGTISVASAPGQGAAFRVCLPLAPSE
jgi:two-component system sensor kinase FixL